MPVLDLLLSRNFLMILLEVLLPYHVFPTVPSSVDEHQEVISRSLYKVLAGQDRVTGHAKPNPAKASNRLDANVWRMNHREDWGLSYAVALIRFPILALCSGHRVLLSSPHRQD
jgi:hypothetical protein